MEQWRARFLRGDFTAQGPANSSNSSGGQPLDLVLSDISPNRAATTHLTVSARPRLLTPRSPSPGRRAAAAEPSAKACRVSTTWRWWTGYAHFKKTSLIKLFGKGPEIFVLGEGWTRQRNCEYISFNFHRGGSGRTFGHG